MNHASRCLLAAAIGLAFAGAAVSAPQASAPMGGASMPHDCKPRHDHGAEKGMPMSPSMNCAKGAEGSASAPARKAKPNHEHSKFHKNQG